MNEDLELIGAGSALGVVGLTLNLGWILLAVIAVTVISMLGYRAYKRSGGRAR